MLRGYRGIILAAVGWLILAASPPERQGAKGSQSPTDQRQGQIPPPTVPPLVRTQSADPQDAGCDQGRDDRKSDLCAQWKAADAAYSATNAAWLFGLLGTVIGGCTLIAAVMAARYARDAAKHTERGANEAERAADAAHDSNRAWLVIRDLVIHDMSEFRAEGMPPSIWVNFDYSLENVGQSPALNVEFWHDAFFSHDEDRIEAFFDRTSAQGGFDAVAPGEVVPRPSGIAARVDIPDQGRGVLDGSADVILAISISYVSGADTTQRQLAASFEIGRIANEDGRRGAMMLYGIDRLETADRFDTRTRGRVRMT